MNKLIIDLSHHNGDIDFNKVYADGVRGIIHKAGEGLTSKDHMFKANTVNAQLAGLNVGAYHFIRGTNGTEQAKRFLDIVPHDYLFAIDAEDGGITLKELINSSEDFAKYIIEQTGKIPLFYINRFSVCEASSKGYFNDSILTQCPLWVARYNNYLGDLPYYWKNYTLWQYSESGHVDGISGDVDLNDYSGTEEQLKELFANQAIAENGTDIENPDGKKADKV